MSEILNIIGKIPYSAVWHETKCLRYKSTRAECKNCVMACPYNNISIENNKVRIHDDCIGCGACAWSCPSGAITYPKIEEDIRIGQIYIGNFKHLKIFSLNYFSYLYLKGVRVLLIGKNQELSNEFNNNFNLFQKLLKKNSMDSLEMSVFDIENWEELNNNEEISRADLFSSLINISKQTADAFLAKKEKIKDYLLELFPNTVSNSLAFIELDENCNNCGACTILCPRNALKIQGNKLIQTGSCNECNLCMEICPKKSISLSKNLSLTN